ncbi:isopentenyl-diphosphate Delta-isomerase [Microbulbifer sp.]|uniref:isopentenyl-diphosphate Delta-isomerase n=1 Tax=Microbulbifer sp. TaxID=1908541 RepID=UPI003F2EAC2B
MRSRVVSFDNDELVLVDDEDKVIGYQNKKACHDGEGLLHRAFSIFLFNAAGELLVQQRSASKRLWPKVWSNSCCSHPRRGESILKAAHRRLDEELSVKADLRFLYKFRYQASYLDLGSEHEICSVFLGEVENAKVRPNRNEILDWRFIRPAQLDAKIQNHPEQFTPWMKMEWELVKKALPGAAEDKAAAPPVLNIR